VNGGLIMGKPGAGKQPKTQREVLKYGRSLGGVVEKGSKHLLIVNRETGAKVPVPYSTGDIATGTLHNIMKMLGAAFVVALVCAVPLCLVACLVNGLSSMY